jgi:hypothetical protein
MYTTKSLYIYIYIYIYNHIVSSYKKKVLACILVLITSLLKSRELANISKIPKNLFCFLVISRVMTLYVRRIPDIKFFC